MIYFLLIGLLAGWLAGQIMKGSSLGLLTNLVVGVAGSFLGGFLFRLIGLEATHILGELLTATVGAIILLVVIGKVGQKK